jgi:PAS domain S-box-containing protein
MAQERPRPTGRESPFKDEELIVSKTDIKGRITYANDVFLRVSKMEEAEAVGAPHSVIRHPDMPRAVFKLLWDRIQSGKEIFAYVLNMAKDGDHYWVFAHVTPGRDADGNVLGYHSNRRKPSSEQIAKIAPLYRELAVEERRHADRKEGLTRSTAMLQALLEKEGKSYEEFVFSV